MKDSWKMLEECVVDDSINIIHCDTRDFHCIVHTEPLNTKDGNHREISRQFHNYGYQIKADEIVDWLKGLREISGGGKVIWRQLRFNKVEDDNWLKYIRMYRNPKDKDYFIVCNSHSKPILWKLCTEENIIRPFYESED